MAGSAPSLWWRLLGVALVAVALAGAFWAGFELGHARVGALAVPEIATLMEERDATVAELGVLRDQLEALRQEAVVLERNRHIERETNSALKAQLKQAQDERLTLVKEGSYLKRLVQEGGRGAVQVHDFRITRRAEHVGYGYAFTVTQLIQEFGESSGSVSISITGTLDGAETQLDLSDLPDANPRELSMHFEHFQQFQGVFSLPEGFVPRVLAVDIRPDGDQLARTSSAFPWEVSAP